MAVALVGAALALFLLFPATKEMVVVVPSADGHVGMVVVERGDDRVILNEAYATSRVTSDGQIHLEKLEPKEAEAQVVASTSGAASEVQRPQLERVAVSLPMFHDAIAALPPRPVSFLLYFVTGTDDLTDASKLELGRMLEELRRREVADIVVIGHTDRVGNEQANDELSLARAERVKAEFVAQGIASAERIRAAGRGEREPVVPTENDVDEPLNRRVEINVR
ncbi:MAG TPA: OmpA family protein [Burkholderiales bacterium]|nr:OmpA family protein [Burkholderiales bacterium]